MKKYAYGQQHIKDLMPWDWAFFSNHQKKDKFNINDEMTHPYFDLKNVKKAYLVSSVNTLVWDNIQKK